MKKEIHYNRIDYSIEDYSEISDIFNSIFQEEIPLEKYQFEVIDKLNYKMVFRLGKTTFTKKVTIPQVSTLIKFPFIISLPLVENREDVVDISTPYLQDSTYITMFFKEMLSMFRYAAARGDWKEEVPFRVVLNGGMFSKQYKRR